MDNVKETKSKAPRIGAKNTTSGIMIHVIIALVPALIFAVYNFGVRALILTVVCVAACVLFEYAFEKLAKRENTTGDLTAVVTGIILAFNLPSTLPIWMAVVGCFVAIVVVKQLFGGYGQNFVNPAVTARAVLLVSFGTQMTKFPIAGTKAISVADTICGATPLERLVSGPKVPSNMDMFIGNISGSLGEVSAAALLIGGIYLVIKKIICPCIPLAFVGTVALFAVAVGQDPVFHILAGGVMLGAIFMATDPTTSPATLVGRIIYGIGCGLITMLIRVYGTYPEGVSFAIILMNILVPHIDTLTMKKTKKAPKAEAAEGGAN
ncbi:MAG: RnfABCDGE type electron transport complex subunit D [Clostridiales bacterium]|nr:RnfABCDGE type electron transport complex subunit D [Clostridiales bacterium]